MLLLHREQRKMSIGAVFIVSPVLTLVEEARNTDDHSNHFFDF